MSKELGLLLVLVVGLSVLEVYGWVAKNSAAVSSEADDPFAEAVQSAAAPLPKPVRQRLFAISPDNKDLVWSATNQVLVATWTKFGGYRKHRGAACQVEHEVWVTPVPQLHDKCRSFGLREPELDRRLKAYLGLPSNRPYAFIAQLWVDPKDLFRPCAVGRIDTDECEPGLPPVPRRPPPSPAADAGTDWSRFDADLAHAEWFQKEWQNAYYSEAPAPWTRLGYTFDLEAPPPHVGASEYIVRRDARVGIASITETEEYCNLETVPREAVTSPPEAAPKCSSEDAD